MHEVAKLAIASGEISQADFDAALRMEDKIQLLRAHLPEFMVENRALYGIVSKGIHELSEKECLDYYDTVKTGIELILDEQLEAEAKRTKVEKAKQAIANLAGKLKG